MEIAVQLVSSLVWPITVLIIVILFRSELAKVFSRLSNMKYKELEVQFGNQLEKVEKNVKQINLRSSIQINSTSTAKLTVISKHEQLNKIAELSPRSAIMSAWFEIENALIKISNEPVKQKTFYSQLSQTIRELIDKKIMDESVIGIYRDLYQLRNQAVHHPEFILSQNEAERYIDVALELSKGILNSETALESLNK